jgi:transcriptional regulator GlxA family with amidase domain
MRHPVHVSDAAESNRRLLRARDAMDRDFARPLDVPSLASIACISEANFIRSFKAAFGETPHRYLQRRRIERAMYLLRTTDTSVTDVCMQCGFSSLGSFSRTSADIVGETPSAFRARGTIPAEVPSCFVRAWTRPSTEVTDRAAGAGAGAGAERSSFGEAPAPARSVP